jgi:hypothetical protein
MALTDQVFVMLLVPIMALIPQLSIAALKKMDKRQEPDRRGREQDTYYFGL